MGNPTHRLNKTLKIQLHQSQEKVKTLKDEMGVYQTASRAFRKEIRLQKNEIESHNRANEKLTKKAASLQKEVETLEERVKEFERRARSNKRVQVFLDESQKDQGDNLLEGPMPKRRKTHPPNHKYT